MVAKKRNLLSRQTLSISNLRLVKIARLILIIQLFSLCFTLSNSTFANSMQSFFVFKDDLGKFGVVESLDAIPADSQNNDKRLFVEIEATRRDLVERTFGSLADLFGNDQENAVGDLIVRLKRIDRGVWLEKDFIFLQTLAKYKLDQSFSTSSKEDFLKGLKKVANKNPKLAKLLSLDILSKSKKLDIQISENLAFSLRALERQKRAFIDGASNSSKKKSGQFHLDPSSPWQSKKSVAWTFGGIVGTFVGGGIAYMTVLNPYVTVKHALINPTTYEVYAKESGLIKETLKRSGDFIATGEPLAIVDPTAKQKDQLALRNSEVLKTITQLNNEQRILSELKRQKQNLGLRKAQAKRLSNASTSMELSTSAQVARNEASKIRSEIREAQNDVLIAENEFQQAVLEKEKLVNELNRVQAEADRYELLYNEGAISASQRDDVTLLANQTQQEVAIASQSIRSAQARKQSALDSVRSLTFQAESADVQAKLYASQSNASVKNDILNPHLVDIDQADFAIDQKIANQKAVVNQIASELGVSKDNFARLQNELSVDNTLEILAYKQGTLLMDPPVHLGRYVKEGEIVARLSECKPIADFTMSLNDGIDIDLGDQATVEIDGVVYFGVVTGKLLPNQEVKGLAYPTGMEIPAVEIQSTLRFRVSLSQESLQDYSSHRGADCTMDRKFAKVKVRMKDKGPGLFPFLPF